MRGSGRWCPYRTRTCVHCPRGSRLTTRRTGCYLIACGRWRARTQCLGRTDFRNRAPATPAAPSLVFDGLAGPIRTDDPCLRTAALCPAELRRAAPVARFTLTLEASRVAVLSTSALGSDACGTRTRTLRIDGPALVQSSSRARWDARPRIGLVAIEPRPRRPERRALPRCATSRCDCSGGRGRSPASWFGARCAAVCTTPEWSAPGRSNSDPRGKSPPGYQLPQRRTGGSPARSNERRR